MGVFGLGGTQSLRFHGTGKLMSPAPPRGINRSASWKGIKSSGNKSTRELKHAIKANNHLAPTQLGKAAVKIMKSQGISVNITL